MPINDTSLSDDMHFVTHDDMTVMRELLERVKGLSFVSAVPILELADTVDANESDLAFE